MSQRACRNDRRSSLRPVLPVGQITPAVGPVSDAKIFLFCSHANQFSYAPSHPIEGRLAIVTNARWDAVDAMDTTDERGLSRTAKSCGSGAPTLALSFAEMICEVTVARKPGHREEHEVSRKPPRREGRIASAEPVCSCAFSCVHLARETAGAARTRSSLRPP
jgi:hypothetical protein